MSKKVSELNSILQTAMETGMEFEIEQEGVSYKVSMAQIIQFLESRFLTLNGAKAYMPYTGGTFTGRVVAKDEAPTSAFNTRNIKAVATDPGVGSSLTTGQILLVYEA